MLANAAIVRQLLNVLQEAVEGSSGPWSYFIDNRPGGGLLGALESMSPAEASRLVGGTSIAAHVHHVAFAMNVSAAQLDGDTAHRDWDESWRVTSVDEAGWAELVAQLRREYQTLRGAMESRSAASEDGLGGAVGAIAHVAYHLGAIRQKLKARGEP